MNDVFGGDAEVLIKLAGRRRSTERRHADETAVRAHIGIPTHAYASFDRDPHRTLTKYTVAVFVVLLIEQLPSRHRDDGGRNAFALQGLARHHGDLHFRTGGEYRRLAIAVLAFR